jgi:hypothetical protein
VGSIRLAARLAATVRQRRATAPEGRAARERLRRGSAVEESLETLGLKIGVVRGRPPLLPMLTAWHEMHARRLWRRLG